MGKNWEFQDISALTLTRKQNDNYDNVLRVTRIEVWARTGTSFDLLAGVIDPSHKITTAELECKPGPSWPG